MLGRVRRARKDAMLDSFIRNQRFPHEPIAVFESNKGPLAFLMLSATPFVAGWLVYHGILDLLAIMGPSTAAGTSL